MQLLLLAVAWSLLCLGACNCGIDSYPTSFINLGQTGAATLQYGSALGPILTGSGYGPVLGGCTPKIAATGVQPPYSELKMTYAAPGLVADAHNTSRDIGSYQVQYEPVPAPSLGSPYPLRPTQITLQGTDDSQQTGSFSYDAKGRLAKVDWLCINVTSTPVRTVLPADHNLLGRAVSSHRINSSVGAEFFSYEDGSVYEAHVATYRSTGCIGELAVGYSYSSDHHGRINKIARSQFEPATGCDCKQGTYCCRSVGADRSSGWCADETCEGLGDVFEYAYQTDNRVSSVSINNGLEAQRFVYNSNSALIAIQQNVSTAGTVKVVDMLQLNYTTAGEVQSLLAWIMYPLLPEAWGFE